jgi:hypothetical protein
LQSLFNGFLGGGQEKKAGVGGMLGDVVDG